MREALFVSLTPGTGLRLAQLVGLDVGDADLPGGQPPLRIRLRAEIARRGRTGNLFLPQRIARHAMSTAFISRPMAEWRAIACARC